MQQEILKTQSCQQQGHENNQVSYICVEQKCELCRFVCQQCMLKDVHRHGKNNNDHIQNDFDFESKLQQDIKDYYAKLKEPKMQLDIITKKYQELTITFQKILQGLENIIENLHQQFNKELLIKNLEWSGKQNFQNLTTEQVEQLLRIQYTNFQPIDQTQLQQRSFQLTEGAYDACLAVSSSSLFQQQVSDKISLYMESISKRQSAYEYLNRGKIFDNIGFKNIAQQFYEQVIADKYNYYDEEAYKQLIKLTDLRSNFKEQCELNEALIKINRKYAKDWLDQLINFAIEKVDQQQYDEASNVLDIAIQIDSKFIPPYQIKAQIYTILQQNQLVHQNYQKIIHFHPKLDEIYFKNGQLFAQEKDNENALIMFTKASDINYKNETYLIERGNNYLKKYFIKGIVLINLQQYDQAHLNLDKVLKLNKQNSQYYLWKGITYVKQGNLQIGLPLLKQFTSLDQNSELAYYYLGLISYSQKKYEQALIDLTQALKIQPQYLEANSLLGQVNYCVKQYTKALDNFNQVLQMNSKDQEAIYYKAIIFTDLKQYNQAQVLLQEALIRNQNDDNLYLQLGQLMEDQGNLSDALKLYNSVQERNPKSANAFYKLGKFIFNQTQNEGVFNLKQNQNDHAEQQFTKALALYPNWSSPLVGLADIAFERKQYKKALEIYEKVVESEAKNVFALNGIAYIFFVLRGNINSDQQLSDQSQIPQTVGDDVLLQQFNSLIEYFDIIVQNEPNMLLHYIGLACVFYNYLNYELAFNLFQKIYKSVKDKKIMDKCQYIDAQAQFASLDQSQIFPLYRQKFQNEVLMEFKEFSISTYTEYDCRGETFLIKLAIINWDGFKNKCIEQIQNEYENITQITQTLETDQFYDNKIQLKQE